MAEAIVLENENLKISLQSKGAELTSIYHKKNHLEYMWEGDPAVWGKHSPVLFPIVGTLKENMFFYGGRKYMLPRHGFAREKTFSLQAQTEDNVTFLLEDDLETLQVYPFEFVFTINYKLNDNRVRVTYTVANKTNGLMYFSIGGHPAFKVPLVKGTLYNDHYLEFDEPETIPRWPIASGGLIESTPVPFLNNSSVLRLTKDLFSNDAIVFKDLKSSVVSLKCSKSGNGIQFHFPGFSFLGLWAAKNGDFVCIEPWCGIADNVESNQQLVNKEGIIRLEKDEVLSRWWETVLF